MQQAGVAESESSYLIKGFTEGFNVEYEGPCKRTDSSANLPFRISNAEDMWQKIVKEVKLNRYAGPFERIPYKHFVQSPIGLVPKSGNRTHLIFHLSYDFELNKSVNYYIPEEKCSVKYKDLDHAVRNCLAILKQHPDTDIWMGIVDVLSAFRLVPTHPKYWFLFILKAKDPETGKTFYFVDKCLPFGLRISCKIFQRFSDSLVQILGYLTRLHNSLPVSNYLDDFLFLAYTVYLCNQLITKFLEICDKNGVPISEEKMVWGSVRLVFLGILLEGHLKIMAVPEQKRQAALNLLSKFLEKKKATVKELQSLAGLLNFLNQAIHPGRAFTRRMYAKFSCITAGKVTRDLEGDSSSAVTVQAKRRLNPYHHISLDAEFRSDCRVWQNFLESGSTAVCRPFVDLSEVVQAEDLFFFTDSSANQDLGMGAVLGSSWMFGQW